MAKDSDIRRAHHTSSSVANALITGAAVLPLGIGLGITAKNVLKERANIGKAFKKNSMVASDLAQAIRNTKGSMFPPMTDRIDRMNWEKLHPSHVVSSFNQAIKNIPSKELQRELRDKFKGFKGEAFDMADFANQLLNGDSLYKHRAKQRFLHNLGGFNRSIAMGHEASLGITNAPFINRIGNPVNLGKEYPSVYEHLKEFEAATGSVISATRYTRPGVEGAVLNLKFSGGYFGEEGDFHLNMPLEIGDTGMVTSGLSLKNQNIVGRFPVVDLEARTVKSTLRYEEMMALRMKGELVSRLNAIGIDAHGRKKSRVLRAFADEMREPFENVPNFQASMGSNPYDLIRARAAGQRTLVDVAGNDIRGKRLMNLLQGMSEMSLPTPEGPMNLYPMSPNKVLGGTFTTMNPAKSFAFPEMVAASRRPDQAIRQYVPTSEAAQLIANDPLTQRFNFMAGEGLAGRSPAMWAMYTNNIRGKPGLSLGESLASSALKPMLATETIAPISLSYNDLSGRFGKNSALAWDENGLIKPASPVGVKAGEFLGYDAEGGAIFAHQDMDILGGIAHPNEIALTARLRSPNEQLQRTRAGTKGMRELIDPNELQATARQAIKNQYFAEHIQAIISMDELRKNRNLHHQQMFSALVEYTHQNMGAQASKDLLKHYDPIRQAFVGAGDVTTTSGMDYMAALASGLTPEQAGGVFGGIAPEQLLGFYERNKIPMAWRPEIEKGVPRGIAFEFAGGPHSLYGAGTAMASIEPRVLGGIKSGVFGDLGDDLYRDLAQKRMLTSPEVKVAQGELGLTLHNLNPANAVAGGAGIDLRHISEAYFNPDNPKFIFGEGATINFGGLGGLQDVHVPSGDVTKFLSTYATKENQIVQSDVAYGYEDFIRAGQRAAIDPEFAKAGFRAAHEQFTDLMRRTVVSTVTGEGGLARGKVAGSQVLTAGNLYLHENEDIRRIGLSAQSFESMVAQMGDIGINTEEMASRFFGGAEVGGMLLRHPAIGPHSLQAVRYYYDAENADHVAHIPVVKRRIYIDGKEHVYDWSTTKGLAADFDGDTVHAILAHPDIEAKIRTMAMPGSAYSQEYENFARRSGFFKPSVASEEGTTIGALLKGDVIKGALTEEIGLLSHTMTRAKEALRSMPPMEGQYDALSLLELFEQHGISAKKFSSEQAAQGATLLQNLRGAISGGGAGAIRQSAEEIFGADSLAMKMLTGDVKYSTSPTGEGGGVIKGMNLERASLALERAEQHFGNKVKKLSPEMDWHILMGHQAGRTLPENIGDIFSTMREGLLGPFGSEGFSRGAGINAVRETLTTANKLKAIGEDVLHTSKKPLLWGFGTSLAIGALLSAPRASLDSTSTAIPSMGSSTGDSGAPENTMPPSLALGQPLAPRMATNPAPVDMSRIPMSGRMTIHTRSHGHFDAQNMGSQVRNVMGNRTHVRTTVNDNRRHLTAQKLSDIMDR